MKAIEMFPHVNDLRDRFFPAYAKLTPEQLHWKPEGYPNSIHFFLRHIAQAEDWFLQSVILGRQMTPKRKGELPDAEALLGYLRETREHTLAFLREHDRAVLEETRTLPEGFRAQPVENPTVGWILHRLFDHEVYHLAQVNLLMRLMGLEPPKM